MTKKIVLKLKNNLVPPLYMWLSSISLFGKDSRERTRFNKILVDRINEINEIKQEMVKPHCKTDDKGKLKTKKEFVRKDLQGEDVMRDVFVFKNKKAREIFDEQWEEYMGEELIIDVLEGNKSKIYTIKEILLNTEEKFSGGVADLYNLWCEAFESLPPRPEAKK